MTLLFSYHNHMGNCENLFIFHPTSLPCRRQLACSADVSLGRADVKMLAIVLKAVKMNRYFWLACRSKQEGDAIASILVGELRWNTTERNSLSLIFPHLKKLLSVVCCNNKCSRRKIAKSACCFVEMSC